MSWTTFLSFLHQVPIIIAVFVIYRLQLSWTALESLIGLALILANGIWVTQVFGILAVRDIVIWQKSSRR